MGGGCLEPLSILAKATSAFSSSVYISLPRLFVTGNNPPNLVQEQREGSGGQGP